MSRVALVHDWLVSMRGGEKVLEALCELFPDAALYTLVRGTEALAPAIDRMPVTTSFIDRLPWGRSRYRHYLPLFPAAVSRFDLSGYDLVISSSSCAAKGVRTGPGTLHVCYCHTPMRYIWDQYDDYARRSALPVRTGMRLFRGYLRRWDVATAQRVGHFVANSENVRERIRRIYGREATVIYPPVDVERLPAGSAGGGYDLVVAALVPYKRVDLAVEAYNSSGAPLVVVGRGPEEGRLKQAARRNIEFVGRAGDAELASLYAGCRALIFPGEEDFGMAPVEAMACGKPVVAYARGGALETVSDGRTGILFREQSAASLLEALGRLGTFSYDPAALRRHALRFSRGVFMERMREFLRGLDAGAATGGPAGTAGSAG